MLTEEGVIEKVFADRATVLLRRSAACAHCDSQGACEVADEKNMHVVLANDLHGGVGDRVEISLPAHSLLKLSLVVYFVPVVALIIGAALGDSWGPLFEVKAATGSIIGGGAGLFGTYLLMKWVNGIARSKMEYRPRMTRIIDTEPLQPDDSKSDHTGDTFLTRSTPVPPSGQE
jgi:sigma-E factor negative regulatory protein RseC